ncbi:TetR/AcrR family transcriptional regulator [Demequina sp. NBRC 110051]|uniref:TetR/AcrR family transcriptional regulator n=1 Tax=Demequina sp. NBRC 110051 TaxID=1570340 RepID=UPI0013562EA1|nr:TetR/AcrR family transcriptional regulator [Demequina sp. NBRC 110051]
MTNEDSPQPARRLAAVPAFPPAPEAPAGTSAPAPTTRGPYKKSEHTRAAILDAATTVFAEKGYHAGSMREIARRCDIDQSTVTHHFPNKPALLLSLMHERDRRADEIIDAGHPDTLEQIPEAVLALARHNAQTPDIIALYTLLAAESVTPDHPLSAFFVERTSRVRAGFEGWFAQLGEANLLRAGVTPQFAATAFLALWEGAQLHWLIDREGVDVVGTLETFITLIMRDPD